VILAATMRGLSTLKLVAITALPPLACAGGEGDSRDGSASQTTVTQSGTDTLATTGSTSGQPTTTLTTGPSGGGTDSLSGTTAALPTTSGITTTDPSTTDDPTTGDPCEPVACSADLKALECDGQVVSTCDDG